LNAAAKTAESPISPFTDKWNAPVHSLLYRLVRFRYREDYMRKSWMVLIASSVALACWLASAQAPKREATPTTAIDILIDPDATMLQHAEAANERLRKAYPKGFALDQTHQPHISVLQRFVKTSDLDKVYQAIDHVLADEKLTSWKLTAHKYYYIPFNDLGLAGIVIEPTDDMIRFQSKIIAAVEPFTVKTGTSAAFVTSKKEPKINQPTIDYVTAFVPEATGTRFNPHVTIGLASQEYLKKMLDEKFQAFTFSPGGVSVYQLGNLGTAQKKLKSW
jgi:2'-5' RNA ligase superfamily